MEPIPMAPVRVDAPPPEPAIRVSVNGVEISAQEIAAEAQNHPAANPAQAFAAASEALVIRELLLLRAKELGLSPEPLTDPEGRRESDEDSLTRQVLDAEIEIPEADDDACRRYYANNSDRFRSATLYEAAHILFAADPKDAEAYASAVTRAELTISQLADRPQDFAPLAKDQSDCPSGKEGGNLGQVAQGDTVPEVETFLDALDQGQLCSVPVKSRYGVHVLRLDRRIDGRVLPFEIVHEKIASYLEEACWRRAVSQYVRLLAAAVPIAGVDLDPAASPLVR